MCVTLVMCTIQLEGAYAKRERPGLRIEVHTRKDIYPEMSRFQSSGTFITYSLHDNEPYLLLPDIPLIALFLFSHFLFLGIPLLQTRCLQWLLVDISASAR